MYNSPYGPQAGQGFGMPQGYQRKVSIGEAFQMFFQNYTNFSGRSSRSEYWWWTLISIIVTFALNILGPALGLTFGYGAAQTSILTLLWSLATIIPSLAICVRRLHDIGKSGWWYFIGLIPIVGWILLIVWFCKDSEMYPNKWGAVPNWVQY